MTHSMKLKDNPFNKIASGEKTIELRLYDEKRKRIKVGDRIEFTKISHPDKKLITEVIALHLFSSFKELYSALPLEKCGYGMEELKNASFGTWNSIIPLRSSRNTALSELNCVFWIKKQANRRVYSEYNQGGVPCYISRTSKRRS